MTLDLPFTFDQSYGYAEPSCFTCQDSGMTERDDGSMIPCCECRPDEFEHVLACGRLDP